MVAYLDQQSPPQQLLLLGIELMTLALIPLIGPQALPLSLKSIDNYYKPNLLKVALARLNAVSRSLKVAKSGVNKRNKQASKIRGRK
ncbi:hypothetical protein SCA6_019624 [Theobroma cacao]